MGSTKRSCPIDILIAEDSPTQAEQLRLLLEREGHQVRVAANGRLALESAREKKPALLITDVVMPDMGGYELCKAFKVDDALHDVPVMLVTSLTSILDIAKGLSCGADNFIRKPYDPESLLERIDYLLRNHELRRTGSTQLGLEIYLGGERHFITSGKEQILDLLVSSYEEAVKVNAELKLREREVSHLNDDLQQRAAELEEANRELDSFNHSVSHDLRTPLLTIDWNAAFLQEEYGRQLDEDALKLLSAVREGARRMSQLIAGLLEFSRSGRRPIHCAQIDMTGMVRRVCEELCGQPPQGSRYTRPEFDIGVLPSGWGDPVLIYQVWINLISNAIKYSSRRESPEIRITGRASGDDAAYSVQDNGVGFDMEYADRLFGVFQRLHSADEFSGTGVGLAISQRIIKRHGGHIWAAAEIDKGATFEFTLPRVRSMSADPKLGGGQDVSVKDV